MSAEISPRPRVDAPLRKEMPMSPDIPDQRHVPVLRDRITELLAPALDRPGAVAIDATVGLGGHAEALLTACPQATVIGLDRDPQALHLAAARLGRFGDRFVPVRAVFDQITEVVHDRGFSGIQAALFDLGVSSLQIDEVERGFTYRADAPLDMRMGQDAGRTAADVLNGYDEHELTRILREFGEERFARRIARRIVQRRESEQFSRTGELVDVVRAVIPAASQRTGGHPAKRTFQALRIEVNQELAVWRRAADAAVDLLEVGGRMAVLSYHSLEDRITKQALAAGARSTTPLDLPVELPEHAPYLRLLTRGAEVPAAQETAQNPRAKSARLRAAERTRPRKDATR